MMPLRRDKFAVEREREGRGEKNVTAENPLSAQRRTEEGRLLQGKFSERGGRNEVRRLCSVKKCKLGKCYPSEIELRQERSRY